MAVRMGMRGAKLRCVRLNWTKRIRNPPAMRLSTPERSGVKIKKLKKIIIFYTYDVNGQPRNEIIW